MNSIGRFGAIALLLAAGCPGSGAQTTPKGPEQETMTEQTTQENGQEGTVETPEKAPVQAQPVDPEQQWNLADIYPSEQAWRDAVKAFQGRLPELDKLPGTLGKSPAKLADALELKYSLKKELYRIGGYASLLSDQDKRVPEPLAMDQQASLLETDFNKKLAFMNPEILAIGRRKVDRFVAREPRLKPFAHVLDDILREKPHTLDKEGENLLAATGLMADTASAIRNTFAAAELPWPTIELTDGTKVRLDQAAYTLYRASSNRAERKEVFDTFFGTWTKFEQTLGVSLYSKLKKDLFYAQARHYKTCLDAALDGDNIPGAVYRTLIETTNKSLPTLHRYLRLRARMLGISDLKYSDLYPPLVKSDVTYPVAEAKKLTLAATAKLGDDYVAPLKKGLYARWMDTYPHEGKRSGAYMMGSVYDVHPYVLLNYNNDWEGVETLAHEWGHAMHSYLSNKDQTFANSRYSTFVAEVASTFNEGLLLDYVMKNAKTDDEKLFFLGTTLERLRQTYFRQAMFAEFELEIHELVENGEALTGKRMSELYLALLRRYHGQDKGVMEIEDEYGIEWAYIPHFYYNFYVYNYATSIAASSLLVQNVLGGDEGAKARYLKLLESGGSDYPYELLKKAGVDMATPVPYEAIASRMNEIMDQIEAILDRKEGK